jgi:hypothetical protein
MVPGRCLPSSQIQQLSQDQFAASCRSGRLQRRLPAAVAACNGGFLPHRGENTRILARVMRRHISCCPSFRVFTELRSLTLPDLREAPLALFKGRQLSTIQNKMETSYAGYKNFHR